MHQVKIGVFVLCVGILSACGFLAIARGANDAVFGWPPTFEAGQNYRADEEWYKVVAVMPVEDTIGKQPEEFGGTRFAYHCVNPRDHYFDHHIVCLVLKKPS